MKAVIIGGGAISDLFHIPAALDVLGREHVYLAEPSEEQRDKMKKKYALEHVGGDYREFLSGVQLAIIATPPHLHLEIIRHCLEAGVHVLCEKPLALNFTECTHLLDLQQKSAVQVGMCHTYRFFPNRQEIREKIRSGFFGGRFDITIEEGEPASWESVSGYNFRKELVPGGVFLDAGIHSLDFILWCLGKPRVFSYEDDSLGGLESNLRLKMEFEHGKSAFFRLSRTCNLANTIRIFSDDNKLEAGIFEMLDYQLNGQLKEVTTTQKTDWSSIAVIQLKDFIHAVETGGEPMCSLQGAPM